MDILHLKKKIETTRFMIVFTFPYLALKKFVLERFTEESDPKGVGRDSNDTMITARDRRNGKVVIIKALRPTENS